MLRPSSLAIAVVLALAGPARAQLQVVGTMPSANASVPTTSAVSVAFDRPLDTTTVTVGTFRVFGQRSGPVRGTYSFSNGDRTATLTPDAPFAAGEFVFVNLSHDLRGADASALRAAGYATQFTTTVAPSAGTFQEIDTFSNRIANAQTRIYGAAATDLDDDGFLDLATINEVSADVRVFLNRADGSGLFDPMLPPQGIGVESSPNEPADFDNDGRVDLCVSAADSASVSILLGDGDGTFSPITNVSVGGEPHGIATLDVDGDADLDIVDANVGSNNLALLLNDGAGGFGAPSFFDGGVDGEYGLAAADMDGDGITDLVVAGRNTGAVRTLRGTGAGTFTQAASQASGGNTWVVVLGDVNGDGDLDAATANDGTGTVGVLLGVGDGTFAAVSTLAVGGHTPSVDLGDLDGDGDLDLVASNFGSGYWRRFRNDGSASFSFVEDIPAPSNPSCSILFDADNDGDLDMALTDEIADVVVLMQNESGGPTATCTPAPAACRTPILPGKSKLQMRNTSPDDGDKLGWKWTRGAATAKADFGNPLAIDGYALCLYEDGALVRELRAPAGGTCAGKPCWRDIGKGFAYADRDLTPDGLQAAKLIEGLVDGKARTSVKGKGGLLGLPTLSQLTGVLDVQLQKTSGGVCWGARFSPPFLRNDGTTLRAVSDTPTTTTTTLPPLWSAIHAQVIGPRCGSCHGTQGGLTGLGGCDTGHASLVNVPSTELPSMDRVEPGMPGSSWLMHKLDGTQDWFIPQCSGMFCGSQMPLGGPYLDQGVRDAIRTWITDGALNDCP